MTIHESLDAIDTTARHLVRDLDWSKPKDAVMALGIVDRVSEIRRALGMPAQVAAAEKQEAA